MQQIVTKMANKIVFPQPVPAMYCYKLMNLNGTFSQYRCKVNVLSEGAKTYEVRLLEQIRLHAIGDVIKVKKKNITFYHGATDYPAPSTQRPSVDCTDAWWHN